MATRTPKTPSTTTTETKAAANPPTFNLDDVNKILAEALAKQAESMAVAKPSNGKASKSAENEWAAIKAFQKAGFGKVVPNVDVFTFNRWISQGFRPVEGSKAVKVNNLRLFCAKQVRPLTPEEKQAMQAEIDQAVASNKAKIVSIETHLQ
jgi:hypothetical protein